MRGHRFAVAAAACSWTASALLTGCGGGQAGTTESASPPSRATPVEKTAGPEAEPESTPTADVRPEVDVRKVLLTRGDLAEFRFDDPPVPERTGSAARTPASCGPVENVRLLTLAPKPGAAAVRLVTGIAGDATGTVTTVALASYDRTGAQQIMADLRTAVAGCADGYRAGTLRFTSVSKEKPLGVADEEVSYALLGQDTHPASYTVIRVGSTVALFSTTTKTGTDGVVPIPTPVVYQQYMKLQAALGGGDTGPSA